MICTIPCKAHSWISATAGQNAMQSSHQIPVVEGDSSCYQCQDGSDNCYDYFIMWMKDAHKVDIAENWKRHRGLRQLTRNSDVPQRCERLVAVVMWQYNFATYSPAVDLWLPGTTSTLRNSIFIRFKPIDSPLCESSWNWLSHLYSKSESSDGDLH